jgi:hypothetical protein
VYRRLSIRVLCVALLTLFALPAWGQYTRDNAANKKIDEAVNEHYLATNFDKAEGVLTGTIQACGEKCSPQVLARAWMYVGIVRGSGKNDQGGAKDAFQKAIAADPKVKLDAALATPETQKSFNDAGGSGTAAAPAPTPAEEEKEEPEDATGAAPAGDLECTPEAREIETLRIIPFECASSEDATSMELRYKPFGSDSWKTVKMKKKGDAFRGEVPCDATTNAGTLRVYVRAKDVSGDTVDSFGTKNKPVEFQIKDGGEAPSYPGESAPERCTAAEECPPDFPGCSSGKEAQSCETDADCDAGTCVEGKCDVPGGDDDASEPPYKKNWLGLHIAKDIAFIGGNDVCSRAARRDDGYACYVAGSDSQPYNGDPYPGAGIATGAVSATTRILVSYDRAFTPKIMAGLRLGFAFGGGPPAGKQLADEAAGITEAAGTAFLPLHAELRASYWILGLAQKFRPYVHVGGGMAQVDAKVEVDLRDCTDPTIDPALSNDEIDDCAAGDPDFDNKFAELDSQGQLQKRKYDAWKKMGQGFITVGGGLVYAFKPNMGVQLNVNLMYMLPTSGPVIQPSLGFVYGL